MDAVASLPWWGWTLIVLGSIALIMVIAALFVPDFHQPKLSLEADPEPGSPEFMDLLAEVLNSPVRRGDSAEILQNGNAFFGAMEEAMDGATSTINFQCYIWESGKISDRMIAAMVRARGRGVDVRVHPDAFGAMKFKDEDRKRLTDAGVKLQFFRPLKWYSMVRAHKRSHQRAIIIDGHTAFTGGAAVADKWDGDARNGEEWRDNMCRFTGELAGGIQAAFANDWVYSCGEILSGRCFFPAPAGDDLSEDKPVGVTVVSSPTDTDQPVRLCFWMVFRSARERLVISNSYFIPDDRLRAMVVERARAGVDVRILVPGDTTDARPVRRAGHTYYEELLEAGVRLFEYQKTMMHAKVAVSDGVVAMVGSANLDERSMELNEETVLAVRDPVFAAAVEKGVLDDLADAKEMDLAEWKKRPFHHHIYERCSLIMIEQY
ncbi:MAG: phospholipase D-like domain-containing protein [Gemmatimonadales bacterium]